MLLLTIALTLLSAIWASPLPINTTAAHHPYQHSNIARNDGYGTTHRGMADLNIAISASSSCDNYNSLKPADYRSMNGIPWDSTRNYGAFGWIAFINGGPGVMDVSSGDNCETFIKQIKQPAAGLCIPVLGECLHYWNP